MSDKSQLAFGPLPVQRLENRREGPIQKVDMTYDDAKQAVARIVQKTITRSNSSLKDFGDASQVGRWCKGENPNLARLFQSADVRRHLVQALAEESGMAEVEVTVRMRA